MANCYPWGKRIGRYGGDEICILRVPKRARDRAQKVNACTRRGKKSRPAQAREIRTSGRARARRTTVYNYGNSAMTITISSFPLSPPFFLFPFSILSSRGFVLCDRSAKRARYFYPRRPTTRMRVIRANGFE